jgi:hypothetical protein
MKIDKPEQIFLVLVPHRDTRLVLRNYSAALLKKGFTGAYCFPWVSPLAVLSRPLNPQELKNIANAIRKSAKDGKFNAEGMCTMPFPPEEKNSFLSGPRLDFTIPRDLLADGIGNFFSQTVIGARILSDEKDMGALPCPPKLSFSAAAIANMVWQTVSLSAQDAKSDALGYKWKIGKLFWLPNQKRAKPGHVCH